jgi:hypothetical protein
MPPDKKSARSVNKNAPADKSISIDGDVVDSVVIAGNHNVVNKQTIIQKIINFILPTDSESIEQRNRRILLNHVENAWIKGVLDASLHGAALLDLGIKQDPEAVTKYPWAIKKESTSETLSAGTSMLEIFDSIGMGRSLLILGAPGSGKTTMLLELARGLIARAREDVTQPIPMVFNLASWTEKLTLADWLAQELNNLYSVPRKTAPDWVKGNKLLLLLDGLDEVRQESRARCVEAINEFRKQNGLTSLSVCSRSQDYADLNAKLAFEGAIEVQPLTQEQITKFFNRFGDEMAGIKQALEKDSALREMAETPLFLSIMLMAYRDKRDVEILLSVNEKERRKHLFSTYIKYMFERNPIASVFQQTRILHWLSSLAAGMIKHNQIPYVLEDMQINWLDSKQQTQGYHSILGGVFGLIIGVLFYQMLILDVVGPIPTLSLSIVSGLVTFLAFLLIGAIGDTSIEIPHPMFWSWYILREQWKLFLINSLLLGFLVGLVGKRLIDFVIASIGFLMAFMVLGGLQSWRVEEITLPGRRFGIAVKNSIITFFLYGILIGITSGFTLRLDIEKIFDVNMGLAAGFAMSVIAGLGYGGYALIQHYTLRLIIARNNLLPWRLAPFLDHCVDLIFLRRVGGGYIFVHRLLMEHFAEMYVQTPTSKGN